jgi:PAS domain S-box-containing protein
LDYSFADPPADKLQLTQNERAWLAAHPVVRMHMSRTFPPFEIKEDGEWKGLAYAYITEISKRLGIKILPTNFTWTEALNKIEKKEDVDLILSIGNTPERAKIVDLTKPYLAFPYVIVTSKQGKFVSKLEDLDGSRMAVEKGYVVGEWLHRDLPHATLIIKPNSGEALDAVSAGEADAYVGNLAVASYLIDKKGLTNVKIAAPTSYGNHELSMGVRKDWPELRGLIDKVLASMPEQEHQQIRSKWLSVRYEHGIQQVDIIKWVLMVVSISLIFIIQLRRMVKARTKDFEESQEQLQKENARVSSLSRELSMYIRCMPIGCIVWDSDFIIQSWNPAAEKIFGYSASEAIGQSGPELIIPPEVHAEVRKVWQRIIEGTGDVLSNINDNIQKDGRRIVCKWSSTPLRDASGKLYGVLSMVEDVTEQVRLQKERIEATQALEKSEEKFRNIFENAPVGIFQSLPSGQFITINTVYAHIFGYDTAEEMISCVTDITNQLYAQPEQRGKLLQQLEVSDLAVIDELEAIRKDGSHIYAYLSMKAMRDKHGKVEMLEGFLTDITERKRFRDALEDSEKRFRTLIEESPIGISIVRNLTYTYSNRSHAKIFGFDDPLEIIGTPVENRIAPPNRQMVKDLSQKLRSGEITSTQFETVGVRKNGSQFPYLVSSAAIKLSDGSSSITFGVDITERQQALQLMVQSEKMTMIAGMAAGIAHEVNNPLGIISQDLQNLERRFSPALQANIKVADELGVDLDAVNIYMDRREITNYIATMRNAVKRASAIISNMLQFSRQSDATHQLFNLNDILDQSIKLASSDYDLRKKYDFKNVTITKIYDEHLPMSLGSVSELEQVFINLLKNAAQAMFEAGTINPTITMSSSHTNDHIIVTIRDNGPGMSEEVRKRIFDPFFTTKEIGLGTGLGLSVSHSIITKNHGGEITVESQPGQGACFNIKFPLKN